MIGNVYALRSVQDAAGKSVIAANLAFELASSGQKTLLLDLDYVWPSLHRYFNLPRHQASVLAALRFLGQGKLDANNMEELTVRLVAKGVGVDFMSGYRLGDHSELLSSSVLAQLIDYLRSRFDTLVLDCPSGMTNSVLKPIETTFTKTIWVTQIDPISLGRFVDAHETLLTSQPKTDHDVLVLNRMRGSVLGARPEWQVQQVLRDRTHFKSAVMIPDDPIFDQALLKGLPLRQISAKSKALVAVSELASRLQ